LAGKSEFRIHDFNRGLDPEHVEGDRTQQGETGPAHGIEEFFVALHFTFLALFYQHLPTLQEPQRAAAALDIW
jgi:hypothetical protein